MDFGREPAFGKQLAGIEQGEDGVELFFGIDPPLPIGIDQFIAAGIDHGEVLYHAAVNGERMARWFGTDKSSEPGQLPKDDEGD